MLSSAMTAAAPPAPGRAALAARSRVALGAGRAPTRMMAGHGKFFVGGNWKCNGDGASVKTLVDELNAGSVPADVEAVCAPTFVHLDRVQATLGPSYSVAAQNCWTGPGGAFTGEIAAEMLADMGLKWVILGHSERRQLCGESNAMVAEKSAYAQSKGLGVIGCIGETLEERETGELWNVLMAQMAAYQDAGLDWSRMVIAYEPIWAIGTGVVATPEQAQEVHAFLRGWVSHHLSPEIAASLRIIYGGSVNPGNCSDLGKREDIDGFLVGGASLKGSDFVTICNAQQ